MKYSYSWLKEFIPAIQAPKKLADLLTLHAWEVESVENFGDDFILDIAILPNRLSDASGHIGVAREIYSILKIAYPKKTTRFSLPRLNIKERTAQKIKSVISVSIAGKDLCPRYAARAIFGIKVGPSPKWLIKRLNAVGVQSINNIVDITNYVMLETGQPLHAFDYDKLAKNKFGVAEIFVRRAVDKEEIITLDGQERNFSAEDLLIADSVGPLAIAGIKGGMRACISGDTKNIVIEGANFDRRSVYKTAKRLGIDSDAARRFGAGLPASQIPWAVDRVASLITQIAGGYAVGGMVDEGNFRNIPVKVVLFFAKVNSLLGLDLTMKEVIYILKTIGCEISILKNKTLKVVLPVNRLDLTNQEDLIEEIGRLLGYGKIMAQAPKTLSSPAAINDAWFIRNKAKDVLMRSGFTELRAYSFMGDVIASAFGFGAHDLIEIYNPIADDKRYLRPSISPRLVISAVENLKYSDHIGVFEIGNVFEWKKARAAEKEHLSAVRIVKNESNPVDNFRIMKGLINDLLLSLGISDCSWRPIANVFKDRYLFWGHNSSAILEIDGKPIGAVGVLESDISSSFGWPENIVVAEIDFSILREEVSEEHEYRLPSKYPEAVRDIAVLVDISVLVDEVGQEIARIGKNLVRDIELFDYYEGENLPEGKKSLAFHIIYQSDKKTLSGQEIDKLHKKIIKVLTARGWEVR